MKRIDWIHFHPAAGLVRMNVQETIADGAGGERVLPGQDVDYKLEELPSEVRSAIEAAADRCSSFANVPLAAAPVVAKPKPKPIKKKKK